MVNHVDATAQSNDAATPDEPERPATRPEDPGDWRSEFRSHLDDPE